jgi:regulator of replication initiation timing
MHNLRDLLKKGKRTQAADLEKALADLDARHAGVSKDLAKLNEDLTNARIENALDGSNDAATIESIRAARNEAQEQLTGLELARQRLKDALAVARLREAQERKEAISKEIDKVYHDKNEAFKAMFKDLARVADTAWLIYGGVRGNLQQALENLIADARDIQIDPDYAAKANGYKAIKKVSYVEQAQQLRRELKELDAFLKARKDTPRSDSE